MVDEAAQAMELETLIPLTLAEPKTRVFLAGDHMQVLLLTMHVALSLYHISY